MTYCLLDWILIPAPPDLASDVAGMYDGDIWGSDFALQVPMRGSSTKSCFY